MLNRLWNNQTVKRILFFFPVQLLLVHVKNNLVLLLFWVALFGFSIGEFGKEYGVPYLFWDPEYLGTVSFWSFLILGFSCGGFIMAFHISSYIMNAHRFPFLATLSKPFFKYSLNNSLIPVLFIGIYSYQIFTFQNNSELFHLTTELDKSEQIISYLLGFYAGILIFLFPGYATLAAISRDVVNMFGRKPRVQKKHDKKKNRPIRITLKRNLEWKHSEKDQEEKYDWQVTTYMVHWFKIGLTRDAEHYDRAILKRVFKQNHLIAAVFEILILITFIILGIFREQEILTFPAGATIFLLCTMLLLFSSAVYSRLRGWSGAVIIVILVLMHLVSKRDLANQVSKAYGLNYKTVQASYSLDTLNSLRSDKKMLESDIQHHISILRKWKAKNQTITNPKPKLVIICATGGGARSTLWAFRAMQYADSLTNGKLLNQTQLICGASGGMFGLAYLRELKLRSLNSDSIDLYSSKYTNDVSKDLLNPVTTTLALNDLFIKWQTFKDGNNTYPKDRGFSLEMAWHKNTHGYTNKRLGDYTKPERESKIPLFVLTPNIMADGRSLYIGSQPSSFFVSSKSEISGLNHLNAGVEFQRFFKNQDANNLWFSSALRMNATFPYISPAVTLPTTPQIEVMDAGFRDNYGISTALQYLYTFRNWIASNTSGVVIIQIRDRKKVEPMQDKGGRTILNQVFDPVGGIYDNLFRLQDYQHDQQLTYASQWFNGRLDVVNVEMQQSENDDVALSWHLTAREKHIIKKGIYSVPNQQAFTRINSLLSR